MHAIMQSGADVLDQIMQHKRAEVAAAMSKISLADMRNAALAQTAPRAFMAQLRRSIEQGKPAVIAEIKKASPSKGVIREDFRPELIAQSYADHGASCLSVLTDSEFFQGSPMHFKAVRKQLDLPLLRKDFIYHEYQLYEARAMGADCILLIAAVLNDQRLHELADLASELDLDVLLEVHNAAELARSKALGLDSIGINNRNLRNFSTSLTTTVDLLSEIDESVLVITESGIHNREHVEYMRQHGVNAFLVGEAFMRADNPGQQMTQMFFQKEINTR